MTNKDLKEMQREVKCTAHTIWDLIRACNHERVSGCIHQQRTPLTSSKQTQHEQKDECVFNAPRYYIWNNIK